MSDTAIPINEHSKRHALILCVCAILCFSVANIGIERFRPLMAHFAKSSNDSEFHWGSVDGLIAGVVVPVRTLIFFIGLIGLGFLVYPPLARIAADIRRDRESIVTTTLIYLGLLALIFRPIVLGMGFVYATNSINPFAQPTDFFYRRVLMPALAHFLVLRGPALYTALYYVTRWFALLITLFWLQRQGSRLARWQILAIGTSGILIYMFQSPGYGDHLVWILAIASLLGSLSAIQRGALIALMLLAHETVTLAIAGPLIVLIYPRREWLLHAGIIALYFFFAAANFGFDPRGLFATQTTIYGTSSSKLLTAHPWRAIAGVLIAYKALWILWAIAIVVAFRRGDRQKLILMLVMVLVPLATLIGAIDTARLAGLGMLGILIAIQYVRPLISPLLFSVLLILNLLIPSYSISLDFFERLPPPGLYRLVMQQVMK